MKRVFILSACILNCLCLRLSAAEWQWSVPVRGIVSSETGRTPEAYLWIPSGCSRVRAVVVGQHNMSEETLFENPLFRQRMAEENFALVWITPILDMPWNAENGCQTAFDQLIGDLADASGYDCLRTAPVVPVGHSALATFPWNFAAWNPGRTLAVVSLHGDAPRTNLTGYGNANLEWGRTRNIDGIPALMIEGEYEWWEARITPALAFRMMYPNSCISFFGDAGRGHFDVADRTADYIALFLHKAAASRLGDPLKPVDPAAGWLAERWHPDHKKRPRAAAAGQYKGDPHEAFWYFDREMADLTERCYAETDGKRPVYIGFEQQGAPLRYDETLHARIRGRFRPEADGMTFHLRAFFTDSLRQRPASAHPAGVPTISRICGPVEMLDDTTFRIRFDRGTMGNPRRGTEIWLVAAHPADATYKGAVQQIVIDIPYRNSEGRRQSILFPSLPDVKQQSLPVTLTAVSDYGLPVSYYVKEGPAEIDEDRIVSTPIPPRTKFPVRVTIVAWQYGIAGEVQTAEPIERSFYITE